MFWWLCTGVLIAGALGAILWPVLRVPSPWAVADLRGARRLLLREKERVLRLIKDLDSERERDAIHPKEHERLRRAYLLEAAQVQRQLEAPSGETGADESRSGEERP